MKVIIVLVLVAAAVAVPLRPPYDYSPASAYTAPYYQVPARYHFNYGVKDGYSRNDYGHQETRDDYGTKGSYFVQLPDGRLQKVTYSVSGDSGFVAEVTYYGQAHYPAYSPTAAYKPVPAYRPSPVYG